MERSPSAVAGVEAVLRCHAMAVDERLESTQGEAFLTSCVAVARSQVATSTYLGPSLRALEEAYTETPFLVAPVLALDLLPLASGERLLPVSAAIPAPLRAALRRYEDHVLARLLAERRWSLLCDALATLPRDARPAAVGLTVVRLFSRLGLKAGPAPSLAVLRRLMGRSSTELLDAGHAAVHTDAVAAQLVLGLEALAGAARRASELLGDSEVFLVENVVALKGLGPRVALAQLADVAQRLEERLPVRVRSAAVEVGAIATAQDESSTYPMGGFSSLTTSGSLENLVSSELAYMDGVGSPGPDLFDLRFAEQELLYYARDEAVALRRRRVVVVVFDPSLVSARVLDAPDTAQRLVWLCGAVAVLVRKLSEWLDADALTIALSFPGLGSEPALEEEAALLSLVLRPYRERGQLEVVLGGTVERVLSEARAAHRGQSHVLLFGARVPSGLAREALPDAYVDLSSGQPKVHWIDAGRPPEAPRASSLDAWAQVTKDLVVRLLRAPAPAALRAPGRPG